MGNTEVPERNFLFTEQQMRSVALKACVVISFTALVFGYMFTQVLYGSDISKPIAFLLVVLVVFVVMFLEAFLAFVGIVVMIMNGECEHE